MKITPLITGATGMVGEGVLLECLDHPDVEQVIVINRRPGGRSHPKLREIIHTDFFDLTPILPQLDGCNACLFCLGISSFGVSRDEYLRITHDLTMSVANSLVKLNPDLTFCYVTGMGTDSSEKGRLAWARVKGATENQLLALFKNAFMIRPGAMKATPGQRNLPLSYRMLAWMYPVARAMFPQSVCTLREVARAMIRAATDGAPKRVLEVRDMIELSREVG